MRPKQDDTERVEKRGACGNAPPSEPSTPGYSSLHITLEVLFLNYIYIEIYLHII